VLAIVPHELLHAVCLPPKTVVDLYYTNWVAFVYSVYPVSKARFIWISAPPSLVLGALPLFVWLFMPHGLFAGNVLFSFVCVSLFCGGGDLMNIGNAATQMPNGTVQQLSGFHLYWYYPHKS